MPPLRLNSIFALKSKWHLSRNSQSSWPFLNNVPCSRGFPQCSIAHFITRCLGTVLQRFTLGKRQFCSENMNLFIPLQVAFTVKFQILVLGWSVPKPDLFGSVNLRQNCWKRGLINWCNTNNASIFWIKDFSCLPKINFLKLSEHFLSAYSNVQLYNARAASS